LRHKLEDILVIGLAALLCNGEDFEDMEAFGQEREAVSRNSCFMFAHSFSIGLKSGEYGGRTNKPIPAFFLCSHAVARPAGAD
jgi:hypothetical protein